MDMETMWLCHHEGLVRYLLRLTRSQADAEDLAQATFLKALEHAEELRALTPEHARAWLRKVGYRLFIDGLRRGRRQAPLVEDVLPAYEEDFSGLHVEQLLERLPENLRRVVRMRHLEDLSSGQIGVALGLPPATVRTRLRSAMLLLRRLEQTDQ